MKNKILLVVLLGLILSVAGCGSLEDKKKGVALEYLNNKYDDAFSIVSYLGSGGLMYDFTSIRLTSEKYPGSDVEVRMYSNDDGTYECKDNYYHYYMEKDAVSYFKSYLNDTESCNVIVSFQGYIWSDELEGATTFEEWVASETCDIDVVFITNESFTEEERNRILEDVQLNKIKGMMYFIETDDANALEGYTYDEIMNNEETLMSNKYKYYVDMEGIIDERD